MKGLIQLKLREFFSYFKDLGSVDDDPIETRFRRLESKIDRLNDDNTILKEQVNELKETVKKQETEIQRLLGNQRDDKDTNKQDNAAVSIAAGGFYISHVEKCGNLLT